MRGLHARLDLLERESPADAAYVAHLRVLVSEFRMDEFMATLDAATLPGPPEEPAEVPGVQGGDVGAAPVRLA